MTHGQQEPIDHHLLVALHRLADETVVPPVDPVREAALLTAFDAARRARSNSSAMYWGISGALATAAALLIVVGIKPGQQPQTSVLSSHPVAVGEFVSWPGARDLPPLESGELVRVDLPISMLPSLGIVPPATQGVRVKADVIIGQDGLARAVRLVSD